MVCVGGKWNKPPKNICKYCGGKLVVEYIGTYGVVYELTRTGKLYKDRDRKIMYPMTKTEFMIYCQDCKKEPDNFEWIAKLIGD